MKHVKSGLENLIENPLESLKKKRIGYLCNPASVDCSLTHGIELIRKKFPGQLTAFFSPQHGFFAEKQDNMIESEDRFDHSSDIPIFSLYKEKKEPSEEAMDLIDVLIIDLQDAGTRIYTFIYTMSYCLEAAKKYGKKAIILDRPNPVGGIRMEGGLTEPEYVSFVGRYPIPMQHGMTIGELALLFNTHFAIGSDLEIAPMKNWKREFFFKDTNLFWVPPSPNLPTSVSAAVYPGQVIWEGTNISEGRGTTQPFEIFGAPFIDTKSVMEKFDAGNIEGAIFRPLFFEPTFNKYNAKGCFGFQIHITDYKAYNPYPTSLKFLQAIIASAKDDFKWKEPPYEYEFVKKPIDLILGSKKLRKRIEAMEPVEEIVKSWNDDLRKFRKTAEKFFLY